MPAGHAGNITFRREYKMKDYMKIYQEWLSNPYFDEDTKAELRAIEGDENEIKERFYMDLEFGTAGLRGVIGAGINRMNIYVVRRATQGLANYIIKQGGADKGVAIAYDSRHMSPEFAMEAAMTLAANGIKAYKFESLRPTPELSFAVRELGCIAGINITASHNPPEYNGYKVYWEDGAQFTPPHDKGVTEEVLAIEDLSTVKTTDEASAAAAGKYEVIGREIDDKYIAQVKAQVVNQKAIDEMQDQISIVYTPLHGTGNIPARRVMKELGFTHVYVVPEQELPDGGFPTVSYPNPEAAEAFSLGLKLAGEKNADLVLATDPDADRLGVYVKDAGSGEYIPLTGNMSGSLLCEYVLSQKKAAGKIPVSMQQQNMDWWPRIFWDQYCREELDANPNAFEDGSMTFSSESVKKGLEKFKYMWDQGWFPESGLTGNRETMQQLFVQKELVQVMLQPNYLSYLTENVPEGVELASYALPGVEGKPARCLGGSSSIWAVTNSSKHQEEAIEFVKFMTSKTAFSEDYAKFINPGLTNFELTSDNEAMQGYIDAGKNGFIPDIYVPVNITTEIQNTFLTDLEPNYLLGTYDIDYVTDQLNQLYEETYLSNLN